MGEGGKRLRRSIGALLLLVCACSPSTDAVGPSGEKSSVEPQGGQLAAEARLPEVQGHLSPSLAKLPRAGEALSTLGDAERCGSCHADVLAGWEASAHAAASFDNPIYRAAVDAFRDDVSKDASRFCGACHDPILLASGGMEREVSPSDPRARAGVSCAVCHGITAAKPDGNGSYEVASAALEVPVVGDAASVARHKASVRPRALGTAEMCGACHASFLDASTGNHHHLSGQDERRAFLRSAFAGSLAERIDEPIAEQDCKACHMPKVAATQGDAAAKEGVIASHGFAAGHTWLASMRGDEVAQGQAEGMLRGAASIDVAAAGYVGEAMSLPAERAPLRPGETLVLDVVVRSLRVGHRFPGGTLDAQDTWIELSVQDAKGRSVADAGSAHAQTGDDPTAYRLRALAVDDEGRPVLDRRTNAFAAVAFDHTLGPRDAAVVRYALPLPEGLRSAEAPLRIAARLLHRSRSLDVQKIACESARSARGQAFRATSRRSDLDACAPQPITEIARATVWIGQGGQAHEPDVPLWRRLFDHALGLSHALQEQQDEGRPSLTMALSELGDGGDERSRAMVLFGLGEIAARQGRTREALDFAAKAEVFAKGHPALARLRTDAYSRVWQWDKAALPALLSAQGAPLDDRRWVALAVARGSAGDDRGALEAAQTGLSLAPRDEDLLRTQALSLTRLGAPADVSGPAERALQAVQVEGAVARAKGRCSAREPGCAEGRDPLSVYAMRVTPPRGL